MKRVIGIVMIAAPFVALFNAMARISGWKLILELFGGAVLMVGWMALGFWLSQPTAEAGSSGQRTP